MKSISEMNLAEVTLSILGAAVNIPDGMYSRAQYLAKEELRALLDKPVLESQYEGMTQEQAQAVSDGVDEILHGEPAAQHHGKPVAKLHAERLTGKDGEYGVTVEDSEWFNSCRQTGGIFNLYAEPPAPVAADLVHDRAYRDGLKRGFCLGENGQVEQYHKEFSAYQNGIVGEVARLNGVKP